MMKVEISCDHSSKLIVTVGDFFDFGNIPLTFDDVCERKLYHMSLSYLEIQSFVSMKDDPHSILTFGGITIESDRIILRVNDCMSVYFNFDYAGRNLIFGLFEEILRKAYEKQQALEMLVETNKKLINENWYDELGESDDDKVDDMV